MTNIFLGVSSDKNLLKLTPEAKSFWCVFPSYRAGSGDVLLLYFTRKGISQIYRIEEQDSAYQEQQCKFRGMQTIRTILIANLDEPITVQQMKADPILKGMAAIGRNFQATTFGVRPNEWNELKRQIKKSNPTVRLNV